MLDTLSMRTSLLAWKLLPGYVHGSLSSSEALSQCHLLAGPPIPLILLCSSPYQILLSDTVCTLLIDYVRLFIFIWLVHCCIPAAGAEEMLIKYLFISDANMDKNWDVRKES